MADLKRGLSAVVLALLLAVGLSACQQTPPDDGGNGGNGGNGGDGARWDEAVWDEDAWN